MPKSTNPCTQCGGVIRITESRSRRCTPCGRYEHNCMCVLYGTLYGALGRKKTPVVVQPEYTPCRTVTRSYLWKKDRHGMVRVLLTHDPRTLSVGS